MKHIIRNAAKCLRCGDEIESHSRHDWVQCSCGNIFVDGGLDYARRGVEDPSKYRDLTEWEYRDDDDEANE